MTVHLRIARFVSVGALVAMIAVVVPMSIAGQNESANGEQRCINARRLDRTEVVDELNLLFVMRGPRMTYRNTLLAECPALRMPYDFSYALPGSSMALCKGETIGVVARNQAGLLGMCRLGAFVPVSDDEVKALLAAADQAAKDKGIKRPRAGR